MNNFGRFSSLIIMCCFILCLPIMAHGEESVVSDLLTINLETATYEEIVDALGILKDAQVKRLYQLFEVDHYIEPASGISFRGIPWKSTREETESIIGTTSSYSKYITVSPHTVDTDGIGIQTTYENWTLAGYPVFWTQVNYVYPVIDGIMLRDDSLALLYLAEYDIWDVGDVNAVVDDLATKLSKLYGDFKRADQGNLIWIDDNNNTIILRSSSSRVELYYISGDADDLLGAGSQAIQNERSQQEEILRIQNQNNTDGL